MNDITQFCYPPALSACKNNLFIKFNPYHAKEKTEKRKSRKSDLDKNIKYQMTSCTEVLLARKK